MALKGENFVEEIHQMIGFCSVLMAGDKVFDEQQALGVANELCLLARKYEALTAKCAELEMQLEFTKKYLNPEDTSFREMMNTFKELPNDKKDKLIDLARSLAELAKT